MSTAQRHSAGRIVQAFGPRFTAAPGLTHLFPPAEVLANANLRGIGLPSGQAEAINALARVVCDRQIHFEGVVDSEDFLTRLSRVRGVGKSTAQYVAMRALNEPDAFPSGDLGLQRALGVRSSRELERRAEAWRPWRAYAAMSLSKIKSECQDRKFKLAPKIIMRDANESDMLARSAD